MALAQADRRKDEFLAMLAHELRNPACADSRNAVELMHRGDKTEREFDWIRGIIDRQVTHLMRLVDDLLDASRISRGKVALTRSIIDLNRLTADAVESIRGPAGKGRDIDVSLPDEPVYVDADAVRLTQVILNLINNAIKFTPKDGRIYLSIERHAKDVDLRVTDTGRGIAGDDLDHVFEMFYQGADAKGRDEGGLGLGLTLVQQLVQMHGGSVRAHSPGPGLGSEFSVRLPLVSDSGLSGAPARDTRPTNPSAAQRILVVDDNRDAVESLAMLLRLDGNDVQVAFDGDAAIRTASRFKPDIILLDIGMPIVDGYTAARTIRSEAAGRDVLLVAMTGWGHADDKRRAMEAGFDAHLVKPVAIESLLELFSSRKPGAVHDT